MTGEGARRPPGTDTIRVQSAADLSRLVGANLPLSAWTWVSQDQIHRFADLTGDRQWIHIDPARAARDLPGGRTIVPGQMLLALVPSLLQQIYAVEDFRDSRVAALPCVRFRRPVPVEQRFRLRARFRSVTVRGNLTRVQTDCTLQLDSGEVALTLTRTDVFR